MKRIGLFLMMSAIAASAFAQFVPGSMEYGLTMNLFENEIDQAFQATPEFGSFDRNFLFAGLGNPSASRNSSFTEATAWDTSFSAPLKVGYYMAGPLPLSFYASAYLAALENRAIVSEEVTNLYTVTPWTTGTTTTNTRWVSDTTTATYSDGVLTSEWNGSLQAMSKLGPVTFGLFLDFDKDNTSSDVAGAEDAYASSVRTVNYDSAGVGVEPVPEQDYRTTTVYRNLTAADLGTMVPGGSGSFNPVSVLRIGIPVALKTGALEHRASLTFTGSGSDRSAEYSYAETLHADSAGGAAVDERTLGIESKGSTLYFDLDYAISLPAGRGADLWKAEAGFGLGINGAEYAYDDIVRPYDFSVPGARTAGAGGTHENQANTYAPVVDLFASLAFSRVFRFVPGSGFDYRFAPRLGFSYRSVPNAGAAVLAQTVLYSQTLDATGALDAAVPYDTTTTAVTGDTSMDTTLSVSAGLPIGFKFKPANWLFGFIMGAYPMLGMSDTITTSSAETTTTTTVTRTGTHVDATDIAYVYRTPVTTSVLSYSFSEYHYIGITVPLENGIRMDARLNGNLLDFESFTIQAFIPFK